MVSLRCKMMVREALEKLDLPYASVELGEIDLLSEMSATQKELLRATLLKVGLELIDDRKSILISRIKSVIIEMVHYQDDLPKTNFSDYLSQKLQHDYTYMANLFSEVQGITIEHFIIFHKVERIKELITYDQLNISEIAWKMNYSSVAHLSHQFKKVTGLAPSHFKKLKEKRRMPIDSIGNPEPVS